MSLLENIPGLSAHETHLPEPVKVEFDADKAFNLIRILNGVIGAAYPEGCLEWLAKHRQDIWDELCAGENAVDRAYIAEDMDELAKATDRMQRMYLRAFKVYEARPPIVEVQEKLI